MERDQEELQFLGVFDIYKESYRIIFSWRKIFSQITLAFIFPLTFMLLINKELSNLLLRKTLNNEANLGKIILEGTTKHEKLSNLIFSQWTTLWLFKAFYFTAVVAFSLLSTSAVVYTVTCLYTGKHVTFQKVTCVVAKVWKRLMVTFLWTFLAFYAYNFVTLIVFLATLYFLIHFTSNPNFAFFALLVIFVYLLGLVWLSLVWQLACVVSVLEDFGGLEAMRKSKALLKGKMVFSFAIFFKFAISILMVEFAFQSLVVNNEYLLGLVGRVFFGIICLLLTLKLVLFGLVAQTILYFVCKSYHHENIDKSALSDRLDIYQHGVYVPLKANKDLQLQQSHV